jgi:hypothetical protein
MADDWTALAIAAGGKFIAFVERGDPVAFRTLDARRWLDAMQTAVRELDATRVCLPRRRRGKVNKKLRSLLDVLDQHIAEAESMASGPHH